MRDGEQFDLEKKIFEPEVAFNFVTKMFQPLLEAKNINLSQKICNHLPMPQELVI
jgi:hypothetical protein